jgi:hypothetical protein
MQVNHSYRIYQKFFLLHDTPPNKKAAEIRNVYGFFFHKKTPPLPQKWGLSKLPNHSTSWPRTRVTIKDRWIRTGMPASRFGWDYMNLSGQGQDIFTNP